MASDSDKNAEITKRLNRLNELRGELKKAASNLGRALGMLSHAGEHYWEYRSHYKPFQGEPVTWPTTQEVETLREAVSKAENEASSLLVELRNLGFDTRLINEQELTA